MVAAVDGGVYFFVWARTAKFAEAVGMAAMPKAWVATSVVYSVVAVRHPARNTA